MTQAIRCAKWCGARCTEVAYRHAMAASKETAAKLRVFYPGLRWHPAPTHNMGWFPRVKTADGRFAVSIHKATLGPTSYTAFFGDKYLGKANSPSMAVSLAINEATRHLVALRKLLRGLA